MLVSATGEVIFLHPTTRFPTMESCWDQHVDDAALVAAAVARWGRGPTEIRRFCAPVPPVLWKHPDAGQTFP